MQPRRALRSREINPINTVNLADYIGESTESEEEFENQDNEYEEEVIDDFAEEDLPRKRYQRQKNTTSRAKAGKPFEFDHEPTDYDDIRVEFRCATTLTPNSFPQVPTVMNFVELYITDEFISGIQRATNNHLINCKQREMLDLVSSDGNISMTINGFSAADFKTFIGCQILMGIIDLPQEYMYFRKFFDQLDPPLAGIMQYKK